MKSDESFTKTHLISQKLIKSMKDAEASFMFFTRNVSRETKLHTKQTAAKETKMAMFHVKQWFRVKQLSQ